ncbi:hypothetical protein F441_05428 [Phytophthora nicotianae CJ01A1]|uniref:Cytochrome c domain-containing protein n=6 Tax=Phytophthora nicotianae TaxID=4792 RepID=W2QI32_PHYN3|nr:hypothetical protein PPTG_09595 [Phytophthora nicotianae INRA-310]ETI51222.1 hypothetical protein F443_05422 [Phytophthora nicotianae P1569]ETK91060.1 hypothetical protein L915_05279 [Phytophthora nicotianae]ETO79964.1 hypothetical protein F444_05467 [Phytophthora nicotianae P1976]ETP20984.1 hypothetical protein F441_05428 [Phytophthora nicotianae CJ01A1]ETP48938.1 hypothetical protein F442_05471 [Phytophthora nicotianae P10297]
MSNGQRRTARALDQFIDLFEISWHLASYSTHSYPFIMQGIFTLALLLLNSWLGSGVEAMDAAHAAHPFIAGGAVVENKCKDCHNGPTEHTLLKHADDSEHN